MGGKCKKKGKKKHLQKKGKKMGKTAKNGISAIGKFFCPQSHSSPLPRLGCLRRDLQWKKKFQNSPWKSPSCSCWMWGQGQGDATFEFITPGIDSPVQSFVPEKKPTG